MNQVHLAPGNHSPAMILRDYFCEAIELEESDAMIEFKKPSEYPVPEELQIRLDADPVLNTTFESLTPGRRKSYIFHISGAKQAKTGERGRKSAYR